MERASLSSSRPGLRGWSVALAGTGINLALGVLYTWSLFKGAIEQQFGWKGEQLNDPYALCCLVFAFTMIVAGRCQDRWGPRATATLGGLLVGMGIGFGYASATPPALKWFPPDKTGLVAGLVVSGFGLAPVYLAPLSQFLLGRFGLQRSMLILGVGFVVMVCGLAQLLVNPPPAPSQGIPAGGGSRSRPAATASASPGEMLRQGRFWWLWFLYFVGAGAGLMVIGSISGMARKSMGEWAFVAVAILAVGNAAGRILAGALSDRLGRRQTLTLVLGLQALLMFVAIPVTGGAAVPGWLVVLVAACMGANYGANLALFPSFSKDFWGLRHFGMNYGLLFTAWGVGGLVLPRLQQMLTAHSGGSYGSSFLTAGVLLVVAALLTVRVPAPAPAGTRAAA